jgi:hypothetical protein
VDRAKQQVGNYNSQLAVVPDAMWAVLRNCQLVGVHDAVQAVHRNYLVRVRAMELEVLVGHSLRVRVLVEHAAVAWVEE